ncbi:MAG TPA: hypothetical protein V6D20_02725 [Candidatus Obscuribacterales bacterium]
MASLDSMRKAEASNKQGGNKDVEIAVRMTIKMLQEGGGMKIISDAIQQSQQPAQVIGQFLAQMIGQLAENLQREMDIDPKIFLAKGGWLDSILNYIEKEMDMPEEFSDEIYPEVLETIKAAAQSPQGGQQAPPQGQPAPGQAPQPQAAMGGLGG